MFKFTGNYILGALSLCAYATVAFATPSPLDTRNTDVLSLCIDIEYGQCTAVTAVPNECIRLFSSYPTLYKQASSLKIPSGYTTCTLYTDPDCNALGGPTVTLGTGEYPSFVTLPVYDKEDYVDFNDDMGSMVCHT